CREHTRQMGIEGIETSPLIAKIMLYQHHVAVAGAALETGTCPENNAITSRAYRLPNTIWHVNTGMDTPELLRSVRTIPIIEQASVGGAGIDRTPEIVVISPQYIARDRRNERWGLPRGRRARHGDFGHRHIGCQR